MRRTLFKIHMSDCHFYISIYAPQGLNGIEKHMHHCKLPLTPHVSGYNGKTILKLNNAKAWFDWSMDSSDTDTLVASGKISLPVDDSWELLETVCTVLTSSSFPHKAVIDDEKGNKKYAGSFLWDRD